MRGTKESQRTSKCIEPLHDTPCNETRLPHRLISKENNLCPLQRRGREVRRRGGLWRCHRATCYESLVFSSLLELFRSTVMINSLKVGERVRDIPVCNSDATFSSDDIQL